MYFYISDGKELGPISIEKLGRLVRAGDVKPNDRVSREGSRATQPAWRILGEDAPESNAAYAEEVRRDEAWAKEASPMASTNTKVGKKSSKVVTRPPWMNRLGDPESTYDVSHSVIGTPIVQFNCPGCDVKLRARIEEVGSKDQCPDCQKEFVTPGPSGDFIGRMMLAAEQKRAAAKEKGVKTAKGIGMTTVVVTIAVAAVATVYYLYLIAFWLTNLISENIVLILTVASLFLFAAMIIGFLVAVAAASDGASGVDNPIILLFLLMILIPTGPLGWLILAFTFRASMNSKA